jgi:isopentenyl-diphosphate Delta-isomerase
VIEAGTRVVLVSETGDPIGTQEKLRSHRGDGQLHLAVSVVIADESGRLLLQRRTVTKYHFAGLWSNACCTHPGPGASLEGVATSRLMVEMGIGTSVQEIAVFTYRARDPVSGLTEHEFDHVFAGRFTGDPAPSRSEVEAWQWIFPEALRSRMDRRPDEFVPWLLPLLRSSADGAYERGWRHAETLAPFCTA